MKQNPLSDAETLMWQETLDMWKYLMEKHGWSAETIARYYSTIKINGKQKKLDRRYISEHIRHLRLPRKSRIPVYYAITKELKDQLGNK